MPSISGNQNPPVRQQTVRYFAMPLLPRGISYGNDLRPTAVQHLNGNRWVSGLSSINSKRKPSRRTAD